MKGFWNEPRLFHPTNVIYVTFKIIVWYVPIIDKKLLKFFILSPQ